MAAGHFRTASLVAIIDRNQLCIDGRTDEIMAVEPIVERFEAFGWQVQRIDGHDFGQIQSAFAQLAPGWQGRPQLIVADTIKGRGVSWMEENLNWHVGNLVGADYDDAVAQITAGLRPAASPGPVANG